jgi:hypothetical protein
MWVLSVLIGVDPFHYQALQDWLVDWFEAVTSQLTAHSAASSLALLRFLPSYQYLAAKV